MRDKIKNAINGLVRFNTKVEYSILGKALKHPEEVITTETCEVLSRGDFDVSARLRPKDPEVVPVFEFHSTLPKFAIVIQGPIRTEDAYTAKTVAFYKKLYSDAIVIVSTWTDENPEALEQVRRAGAEIVQSEKPAFFGHRNVNLQLVNSLAGVKKAQEMGAVFACKTRTDQRICAPNAFEHCINLVRTFPSGAPAHQKGRVVVLGMNYGDMFLPYHVCDFFYFGYTEDVVNVLSAPLDDREPFPNVSGKTRLETVTQMDAPEVYIMRHYLMSCGCSGDFTVRDFWQGVKDCLICTDRQNMDLMWPKYATRYAEHMYLGKYISYDSEALKATTNFDFVNWLNLYCGTLTYKPEYEAERDVVLV